MNDDFDNKDDEDAGLWSEITKDIKPIEKPLSLVEDGEDRDHQARTPAKKRSKAGSVPVPRGKKLHQQPVQQESGRDLDHRTAERLRKGQMSIDARLDLHGLTRVDAQAALSRFIHAQFVAGSRCVLVITGKGAGADGRRDPLSGGQGVLKQSVPQWLNEPPNRSLVLQSTRAKPQHGGDGALYVLLRRKR